jgi:hypothetical protein
METTEAGTTEAHRFKQGLIAGIGATLAGSAISLLLLALHLWPADRPLSVLVVQMVLHQFAGVTVSTPVLYLLAGVGQLAYGALCGGMLGMLAEPVTRASALGFGLLRWSVTQVLVAPALGWGDFGFLQRPWIAVQTLLPHLAYALAVGWLLHQEETGHVSLHLPRRLHLAHARPRSLTSARGIRRR